MIPARVLGAWAPEHGLRPLRRALTERERSAVGYRAETLRGGLHRFVAKDTNVVRAVLHGMLGGFRSLRQQDDNAEMSVNVLLCVLREFPAWAIEEACIRIATGQTDLNERWPPSDAQIHDLVASIAAPYQKLLEQADALLSAPVDAPMEPVRPSKDEVEAKLGRPITPPIAKTVPDEPQVPVDGNHMARVLADIAARKGRAEWTDSLPTSPTTTGSAGVTPTATTGPGAERQDGSAGPAHTGSP